MLVRGILALLPRWLNAAGGVGVEEWYDAEVKSSMEPSGLKVGNESGAVSSMKALSRSGEVVGGDGELFCGTCVSSG
jgi:hypothetical protein